MTSHNRAFGQAIRERRRGKNISQEALAFDAGLDRTYISLLELGHKSPTLNTIMALCHVLDMSLVQLATRVDELIRERDE